MADDDLYGDLNVEGADHNSVNNVNGENDQGANPEGEEKYTSDQDAAAHSNQQISHQQQETTPAAVSGRPNKSNPPPRLHVGNLARETSSEGLRMYFENFGKVLDATVMYHKATNQPKGFGFIKFATMESTETCLKKKDHFLDGKTIDVSIQPVVGSGAPAAISVNASFNNDANNNNTDDNQDQHQPQQEQQHQKEEDSSSSAKVQQPPPQVNTDRKIFVGNLPFHTTDDMLREAMAEFGEIVEAVVIMDKAKGGSKGYGFVTYATRDAAELAHTTGKREIAGREAELKFYEKTNRENTYQNRGGYQGGGYHNRGGYQNHQFYQPRGGYQGGGQMYQPRGQPYYPNNYYQPGPYPPRPQQFYPPRGGGEYMPRGDFGMRGGGGGYPPRGGGYPPRDDMMRHQQQQPPYSGGGNDYNNNSNMNSNNPNYNNHNFGDRGGRGGMMPRGRDDNRYRPY